MMVDSELTNRMRTVCRTLVRDHVPHEAELFDLIWDAVWRSLPADRVEALRDPPTWGGGEAAGAILSALGDTSHQALDALNMVGVIIGAVVTLLNQGGSALLETAQVDAAIREQAARLQAPDHVRRILETFATGLLAEQLAAFDWREQQSHVRQPAPGLLWVESCDPMENPSGRLTTVSGLKTRAEIERELTCRAKIFTIFVDEPASSILACGSAIQWRSLQARHLRLLCLVLKALRHSGVIPHDQIATEALQNDHANAVAIRRAKSELNEKLGGSLEQFVRAEKGMRQYAVQLVPYCWVRLDETTSRLCPDART